MYLIVLAHLMLAFACLKNMKNNASSAGSPFASTEVDCDTQCDFHGYFSHLIGMVLMLYYTCQLTRVIGLSHACKSKTSASVKLQDDSLA